MSTFMESFRILDHLQIVSELVFFLLLVRVKKPPLSNQRSAMLILAQSKFTNFSTSNTTEAIWLNKWNHLWPLRSYELTGFPFNLGNGSCLLRTTTLLLCAKYPFTRFLYISMDIIHSTYKNCNRYLMKFPTKKNYQLRERERESTSSTSMSISSHFNALTITSNFTWWALVGSFCFWMM